MNLFLRQPVHDHPDRLVRAQRYNAEPFRLSIGPILEELHVLEIRNADISYGVRNVLIRGPLKKFTHNSTTKQKLCRLNKMQIHTWRQHRF